MRDLVEEKSGVRPAGPVYLLTHLRYFGYCFNPVSFYYCFDGEGDGDGNLSAIVMEVNNTWNEQHAYVLPLRDTPENEGCLSIRQGFPRLPSADDSYRCRMTGPGEKLLIAIENWQDSRRVFDAHLALERKPITHARMAGQLARDPLITLRVMSLILWQAIKLAAKKAPLFAHPGLSHRR